MDEQNTIRSLEGLIENSRNIVKGLEQEVRELSCQSNPHEDDITLCHKLKIKIDCHNQYIRKINSIVTDYHTSIT